MSTNNNSLYAFWQGRLCMYTTRLRSGLGFLVSYSTLATLALPRLKLGVRSVVLSSAAFFKRCVPELGNAVVSTRIVMQ